MSQRSPQPLDEDSLRKILRGTAKFTVAIALVSYPVDALWSTRYFLIGCLALLNWIALSAILGGICSKRPLEAVAGVMLKPLLLVLLLVAGKQGVIEITSFLLALNSFFLVLFGHLIVRALMPSKGQPLQLTPSGSAEVHG